jgi:cell division protein FtsN
MGLRATGCAAVALCALGIAQLSLAQSISLTPEQRAMLNQLPPEQRQQALQQLEQIQRKGVQGSDLSSLGEELSSTSGPQPAEADEAARPPEEPRAEANSRLVIDLMLSPFLEDDEVEEIESAPVL